MFQRPQQIARAFAKEGYLYFYCTDNLLTDSIYGFWEVEDRLFITHVPYQIFSSIEKPILYIGSAIHNKLLPLFNNPFVIYDHYDDLSVSSASIEDHLSLIHKANLVIVTSKHLLNAALKERSDLLYLPNGVDYDFICQEKMNWNGKIPEDIRKILDSGKPIIGYSGALAEWFDYDLLSNVAQKMTECEFVLIGTNYDGSLEKSGILNCKNIHWLGMKKYEDLFLYINCFSVAIIPFKINEITLSTSPVKLFEYAACHKQIISTDLPECRLYKEVQIASTTDEFVETIERSIKVSQNKAVIEALDSFAKNNTWERRVGEILQYIHPSI